MRFMSFSKKLSKDIPRAGLDALSGRMFDTPALVCVCVCVCARVCVCVRAQAIQPVCAHVSVPAIQPTCLFVC